jgi:hypothetical protein
MKRYYAAIVTGTNRWQGALAGDPPVDLWHRDTQTGDRGGLRTAPPLPRLIALASAAGRVCGGKRNLRRRVLHGDDLPPQVPRAACHDFRSSVKQLVHSHNLAREALHRRDAGEPMRDIARTYKGSPADLFKTARSHVRFQGGWTRQRAHRFCRCWEFCDCRPWQEAGLCDDG